ncbi:MAG TPA: OmpA family protein [Bryobacteraceae bacterium]|nr:OmpA family protein [Bryobacteraceae bacterium]
MKSSEKSVILAVAVVALIAAGCAKKKVAAPPPPPPPPAPTAPAAPHQQPAAHAAPVVARTPTPAPVTPQPHYPNAVTRARIDTLLARIEDAYFDYDKHTLRPDAIKALQADSTELRDILKDYPDYKLTIEGHCDERGSAEYNMALGQERSEAAKDYLVQVGIPSAQLNTISYGKEKPVCDEHDESCWQRNRRIHIAALAQK